LNGFQDVDFVETLESVGREKRVFFQEMLNVDTKNNPLITNILWEWNLKGI